MLLITKKLANHLFPHGGGCHRSANQKTTLFTSLHHLLPRFHLSSTTVVSQNPPPPPQAQFVVDYLVNSCGLSGAQAIGASKFISHIKSPQKSDSVLDFLRKTGLGDADIRTVVLKCPTLLSADVDKTLEPKIRALQDLGFSGSEIVQLISRCPSALRLRDMVPKIEFWITLVGSKEKFLNTIRIVQNALGSSLDKKIIPNIALLREYGISTDGIAKLTQRKPRFLTCRVAWIESVIERVRDLGIPPGSGMFEPALSAVANLSRTTLDSRFKLLKGYGWSEDELLSAFRKNPTVFRISEKKIRHAMEFLLKEAGCPPSYVADNPVLLAYSTEKRLIPRYHVLKILKSRGLPRGQHALRTIVQLTEEKFMERYVLPYGEEVSKVHEAYIAAYAANCPIPC